MSERLRKLTSGRLLARNTIVNLIGLILPMLVAIVAFPYVIGGLGTERFGILSLAWVLIGYFSVFDLGLTRALTLLVAERLGAGREEETGSLIWTALTVVFAFGTAGAIVMALLTPMVTDRVFSVSGELREEVRTTFYILAAVLPFVISTSALGGLLEAKQKFGLVNSIRVPLGLLSYIGPLLVFPFSHSLVAVVSVLAIGRLVAWVAHVVMCLRVHPSLLASERRTEWGSIYGLLKFGGWMTVTNILSPLMVYMDRFLIGAVLSVTAVAYYVTPYEVVTKLRLLPTALAGVLFPAFAASFLSDSGRTMMLFSRGQKSIYFAMFPLALLLVTLAPEGLDLWLGEEFARESAWVLQWLAIGLFVNSLAQLPFSLLHTAGRPDLTAKLHLLELPFYAALVVGLTWRFGVAGTAAAWTIRVAIDTGALLLLTGKLAPETRPVVTGTAWAGAGGMAVLLAATGLNGLLAKETFLLITMIAVVALGWLKALSPQERSVVRETWKRLRRGELPTPSAGGTI